MKDRIINLGEITILETKIKIGVNRKPFTRIYFLNTELAEQIRIFIDDKKSKTTEYFTTLEAIMKTFNITSNELFPYYRYWQLS